MAFVDEYKFTAYAGSGGAGSVRWLHQKGKEFMGPSGGNGGAGGSVYIRAVRDIGLLAKYRNKKSFAAENGERGKKNSMTGKDGEDRVVDFPVGSVIIGGPRNIELELLTEGQQEKILIGGDGGFGNEHFKSSTNQRPDRATAGTRGESGDFSVELKLIVDIGLVGLPNAGKSSLLNALTNANAKVGNYAFTTLEPNLGELFGYIIADIPGLIEGAHSGKGLGHRFLRHVERTRAIAHCISLKNDDLKERYKTVRKELEEYNPSLVEKPEIIVLTKSDESDEETVASAKEHFSKDNQHVVAVTILDDGSIKSFRDTLVSFLSEVAQSDTID